MRIVVLVCAALAMPGRVLANDVENDHERARLAMQAGKIVPLASVLAKTRKLFVGSVLEVELDGEEEDNTNGGTREDTPYQEGAGYGIPGVRKPLVYIISLLSQQGNVLRLEFNAKTMELLTVTGRDADRARRP